MTHKTSAQCSSETSSPGHLPTSLEHYSKTIIKLPGLFVVIATENCTTVYAINIKDFIWPWEGGGGEDAKITPSKQNAYIS